MKKHLFIYIGPLASMLLGSVMMSLGHDMARVYAASITLCCVIWWLTEAIPIPVASLLPIALFPMLDVLSVNQIAQAYGNPFVLLMLGGGLLSLAMTESGAHRRIAMHFVTLVGTEQPRHLVWGFMAAAAFLSMWISNTATALVLLPIAVAAVESSEDKRLATVLFLGIAYACSIGGMGTPIGTPPNLIFIEVLREQTGYEVSFLQWMAWALPVVLVFLPIVAWGLTRKLGDGLALPNFSAGAMKSAEKRVLIIFGLTALAWMTRTDPFGGWREWLNLPNANDASVAFLAAILLFMIPKDDDTGERLLSWDASRNLPWGVLLLFAGGLSIATAFKQTGLSQLLAEQLDMVASMPPIVLVLMICLLVTFLTEVTSNTASASLLLPILASIAAAAGIDASSLMLPAVLSASCAFMLPVATPPNAVVFSSGYISTKDMAKAGIYFNIAGAFVITAVLTVMGLI